MLYRFNFINKFNTALSTRAQCLDKLLNDLHGVASKTSVFIYRDISIALQFKAYSLTDRKSVSSSGIELDWFRLDLILQHWTSLYHLAVMNIKLIYGVFYGSID